MSEVQQLKDENKKLLKEINRLQKSLNVAQYWLDEHTPKNSESFKRVFLPALFLLLLSSIANVD